MTKEEAKRILTEYVKACNEDDMFTLEQFTYEEVIEAMDIGAKSISVLPVSSDLEEAARKYQESVPVDTTIHYCGADEDVYFANRIVDAFITAAKWQEEQVQETIELAEDHAYLAGAVNEREKMMKEAVEVRVQTSPLHGPLGISAYCCNFPSKHPFYHCKEGDKVRVIIVKEDEK